MIAFVLALAALSPAAAQALVPSAWQQTGTMADRRTEAAVTPLPGGDVLVVGGYRSSPSSTLATAERYDAATGVWVPAASMATPRYAARAVALADGRVLVVGGRTTGMVVVASAELYDPVADAWTSVAGMGEARYGHSATLLPDGSVLVAGGAGPTLVPLASAERYDPAADAWSPVDPLPGPSANHTATATSDGRVIVAGGYAALSTVTPAINADVVSFEPASGSWTPMPSLPEGRAAHGAVELADGSLLLAGGESPNGWISTLARLDTDRGAWTTPPVLGRTGSPGMLPLPSGLVLIASGEQAYLYDPVTGELPRAGTVPVVGTSTTLTPVADGRVLDVVSAFNTQTAAVFTPLAQARTAPVDFGEQTTGRRGPVLSVPVTTAGDVPLLPRAVTLEGPDAGDFEIASDTCVGGAVERDETCFVGVRFMPRADGPRTASLVLSAPLVPGERHVVALSGSGVAAPSGPTTPHSQVAPSAAAPPAAAPPVAQAARSHRTPRLRCAARRGRAVVCRGVPRSLGSGRVRVSRNGIVHATGRLANGRLKLTVRRRLYDRRYTLVVGGRRAVKVVLD